MNREINKLSNKNGLCVNKMISSILLVSFSNPSSSSQKWREFSQKYQSQIQEPRVFNLKDKKNPKMAKIYLSLPYEVIFVLFCGLLEAAGAPLIQSCYVSLNFSRQNTLFQNFIFCSKIVLWWNLGGIFQFSGSPWLFLGVLQWYL